ncbi:MAG: protease inhibitor I42 family protein [Gemmatimonadota bacterium]
MTEHTLGMSDRGREVPVRTGDRIRLRLPENPTTGYRWSGDFPDLLRLVNDTNDAGGAPGAAGHRVFELDVVAAGRADVRLVHRREWEEVDEGTDSFVVTIHAA